MKKQMGRPKKTERHFEIIEQNEDRDRLKEIFHFSKQGRPFIKGLAIRNSDQKYKDSSTILPEKKGK